MGKSCDECGADGESLACICGDKPLDNVARRNPVGTGRGGAKASSKAHAKPRDVEPQKEPGPASVKGPRAPQANYSGGKCKCCRCGHIHNVGDRLNEWGQKAGRVMAGRRTECPAGCGYHVTIPVTDE